MLITQLGEARRLLLASVASLTDADVRRERGPDRWSVGEILLHLSEIEKRLSQEVLGALNGASEAAPDRDLAALSAALPGLPIETQRVATAMTKRELIRALEESRFRYLQRVFNETHESTLAERAVRHPWFGLISLKNLIDVIWLHERYHAEQIEGMLKPSR